MNAREDKETLAAIDQEVMHAIKIGHSRLTSIVRFVGDRSPAYPVNDRVVGRSLQRLRNAGKIAYASEPGWHLPSKKATR